MNFLEGGEEQLVTSVMARKVGEDLFHDLHLICNRVMCLNSTWLYRKTRCWNSCSTSSKYSAFGNGAHFGSRHQQN